MTVSRSTCVVCLLCLMQFLSGQEKKPTGVNNSCREFVGKFYSWYLTNASKDQGRAGDIVLNRRPYLLSPVIIRALREDDKAQDKAGSDLVSLDADPFAGGDGLAEAYNVGKVTVRDGRCWAEVHAVWMGKEDQMPDIIPELVIKNGNWLFVNFSFPNQGWNLLGALKALREGEKQGRSSTKKGTP